LILGSRPIAKNMLLSCNRTQSRVVIGLLTGHNTMRRHIFLIALIDSPLCRRCGAEEDTSAGVFWSDCEALASLRHTCLDLFLEPRGL